MKELPEYEWSEGGLELLEKIESMVDKYGGADRLANDLSAEWAKSVWKTVRRRDGRHYTPDEIAKVIRGETPKGRTSISASQQRMKLRKQGVHIPAFKPNGWTYDQIQYLKENYGKVDVHQLQEVLHKSNGAIFGKAFNMGLTTKRV